MFRIKYYRLSEVQSTLAAGTALWSAAKEPLENPTETDTERGYRFIENTPLWKQMCGHLPCFAEMWWPDYLTKVVRVNINGQELIIQLWKGWCERFQGRWAHFPGGIGAEVGIYREYSEDKATANGEMFYRQSENIDRGLHAFRNALGSGAHKRRVLGLASSLLPRHDRPNGNPQGEVWYPYLDHMFPLQFQLVHPFTREVFFGTKVEYTYWLTRWMYKEDYLKYRSTHAWPAFAADYKLQYTINGRYFEW